MFSNDLALAAAMTGVAGCVDSIGYLQTGRFFVSFMSGNTTQFAVALGTGSWREGGILLAIVVLFVLGVCIGRLIEIAAGPNRRSILLGIETALLASAAAAESTQLSMALLVTAMGLQNGVVHEASGIKTGLTYVTGTLVSLGQNFADAIAGVGEKKAILPPFWLWAGLLFGATIGTFGFGILQREAALVPAAGCLALAIATELLRRRKS